MKNLYGYICNTNEKDYELSVEIVKEATQESIYKELEIARECVLERKQYISEEELGVKYNLKDARIKGYIKYYEQLLAQGKLIGYSKEQEDSDARKVYFNIQNGKQNENYINMEERLALQVATKYISTLNDREFIQTLQDTGEITEEQYQSLTRKYKDIKDLKKEAYMAKRWKEISKAQKEAIDEKQENIRRTKIEKNM